MLTPSKYKPPPISFLFHVSEAQL